MREITNELIRMKDVTRAGIGSYNGNRVITNRIDLIRFSLHYLVTTAYVVYITAMINLTFMLSLRSKCVAYTANIPLHSNHRDNIKHYNIYNQQSLVIKPWRYNVRVYYNLIMQAKKISNS